MEELAKKFMEDHMNPLVKVELAPGKLYFENEADSSLVEKYRKCYEEALNHSKVDRRCARALAKWIPEKGLAEIMKKVGNKVKNFGYQDSKGLFVFPEEMLYLMENNRLEVQIGSRPLSILEGFDIISNDKFCNLLKYRVYKKFVNNGFHLIRHQELIRRKSKESSKTDIQNDSNKRLHDDEQENKDNEKRIKLGSQEQIEGNVIENVFMKLRQNMPQTVIETNCDQTPEYYMFSPNNTSKTNPNYNLFICQTGLDKFKINQGNIPSIYALSCNDNLAFFQFFNVNIPCVQ